MDTTNQRALEDFPPPYRRQATVYDILNFDKDVSDSDRNGDGSATKRLRIAKCVVVGDIAVGKTSLINRFSCDVFDSNYKATIGVDFDVQHFTILGIPFSLQIWDTAGQERFKCIANSYYRGTHVVMVVFDMSNIKTLFNAEKWLNDVLESNKDGNPLVFLVGTKADSVSTSVKEEVETEAMKVAKTLNGEYWSVSGQTGQNVDELFKRIAALTFQEMPWHEIEATEDKANQNDKKVVLHSQNLLTLKSQPPKGSCLGFGCS